jgi:hypothetical protein
MNRRDFAAAFAAVFGATLTVDPTEADAQPARRARRRRVRRRVVRRRYRRAAVTRVVLGRRLWVVPVGLAIGWELVHDNRVVVVREIKVVEREGARVEVAVVQDSAGKTEEVEMLREDTADNRKELEGTVLADSDRSTPGVETEIEEEVED